MYEPRIVITIDGLEKVQDLIRTARVQADELESTMEKIRAEALEIQVKINQPQEKTDG